MSSPNVILAVHEKKLTPTDLQRPLRNYISVHYSESHASSASDDLDHVQSLRTSLESPLTSPSSPLLDHRRDLLISYFKALSLIDPRFPSLSDSLSFTWFDAFKSNKKHTFNTLQFEKASVLFNLGAVHSQIGIGAERGAGKGEGIKVACNAFQAAAGVFGMVKEKEGVRGATVDVTPECGGMLERLMLAQAQECFFERVIGDGKSPGLCSSC